jgi:hypothetical protein
LVAQPAWSIDTNRMPLMMRSSRSRSFVRAITTSDESSKRTNDVARPPGSTVVNIEAGRPSMTIGAGCGPSTVSKALSSTIERARAWARSHARRGPMVGILLSEHLSLMVQLVGIGTSMPCELSHFQSEPNVGSADL